MASSNCQEPHPALIRGQAATAEAASAPFHSSGQHPCWVTAVPTAPAKAAPGPGESSELHPQAHRSPTNPASPHLPPPRGHGAQHRWPGEGCSRWTLRLGPASLQCARLEERWDTVRPYPTTHPLILPLATHPSPSPESYVSTFWMNGVTSLGGSCLLRPPRSSSSACLRSSWW